MGGPVADVANWRSVFGFHVFTSHSRLWYFLGGWELSPRAGSGWEWEGWVLLLSTGTVEEPLAVCPTCSPVSVGFPKLISSQHSPLRLWPVERQLLSCCSWYCLFTRKMNGRIRRNPCRISQGWGRGAGLPLLIWVPCVTGCVMWSWAECADCSIWSTSREQRQHFFEFSKTIIIVFSFQNSYSNHLRPNLNPHWSHFDSLCWLAPNFAQFGIFTRKVLQCCWSTCFSVMSGIMGKVIWSGYMSTKLGSFVVGPWFPVSECFGIFPLVQFPQERKTPDWWSTLHSVSTWSLGFPSAASSPPSLRPAGLAGGLPACASLPSRRRRGPLAALYSVSPGWSTFCIWVSCTHA